MTYFEKSVKAHQEKRWKLEIKSKFKIENKDDLSIAYTPGVAQVCQDIAADKSKSKDLTFRGNTVAVVTDGSAVLWLWNIWPEAALPVMEWKAVLFKEFAWVDAFPIALNTQDSEEIIKTVKYLAPTFAWINLEDIAAPRCFEIEETLKKELDIPVFHDDQHGTAIVVLAGLINALNLTNKNEENIKVVVNGLGAAWTAIVKLLLLFWVKNIIVCDSKWIISSLRTDLNSSKKEILQLTNPENIDWQLKDAIVWTDVFVWVSVAWALTPEMVKTMNQDSIIFAMANPIPEIMPDEAKAAWAKIVATWRSDFPNQLNNVLVFPWLFKWAIQNKVSYISDDMKLNAAWAIAKHVKNPTVDEIIPSPLDKTVADEVAKYIC